MVSSVSLSPETLRKALEWELSLSCDDLRSHGWFHGPISRQRAEVLLHNDGDFLVRDCHSRPGDYVLSAQWKHHHLHFVINKVICQPHTVYERIQYAFEDEPFDTVPDLVTFYVGNRRPVSSASGTIISNPVTRSIPLNIHNDISKVSIPKAPSHEDINNSIVKCSKIIIESQQITNEESRPLFALPSYQSNIDPRNFHTYLMPKDNKPFDSHATIKIHSVLTDTGPRIIANHLTKCDIQFIHHDNDGKKTDLGLGVNSLLELLLLPHGEQSRDDLLDRFSCLKYFIIISILTSKDNEQRVQLLSKWIDVAMECKTALGDCFAFEAIMESLSSEPITGLRQTWAILRQKYTKTAICYETKLRPMAKNMFENPASEQAPNTTFPSVLTLTQLLMHDNNNLELNMDLQQLYNHCDYGRMITSQLDAYRRNARIVLESVHFEDLLLDMFRTEFHRRYLWGTKGCDEDYCFRIEKIQQIIVVLSNQQCD